MKIVLDSNVLLISLGKRSKFRPIWDAFITGKFQLIISEDIIQLTYYHWNSITQDIDDNNFFDIDFAGNANYLVTDDKHFNEVRKLSFPKVNIISSEDFLKVLTIQ